MNFNGYEIDGKIKYTKFAILVRTLLKNAITEAKDIKQPQSTKSRAKTPESLKIKLAKRKLINSENIENEIKDLAGVRLIFYTETDVDRFLQSRLIPEIFEVDWSETRIHYPTDQNSEERYQAFHYTVSLKREKVGFWKYRKFKGMRCEVQIQTILNHAWSESTHDMIYKPVSGSGFGTSAQEKLKKQMYKVMDDYLRPAAHEFIKAQHDYERLLQGKDLFDRDEIDTLAKCDNNNDRHEIISKILEYVIPHYDEKEIVNIYAELLPALEGAIIASRNTETKPIESLLGNLPGKTSQHVTSVTLDVIKKLWSVNLEATLRTLITIFKEEKDKKIRQQIVDVVKNIAGYNLQTLQQVGYYVLIQLADMVQGFSKDELINLRPIAVTIWRELLGSEGESISSSTPDNIIFNRGALYVDQNIKKIREKAVNGLFLLLDNSFSDVQKQEIISALQEGKRTPTGVDCSNELRQLVLEDNKKIVDAVTQRITALSYEILEGLEYDLLRDYHIAKQFISAQNDKFGCKEPAKKLMESIISFRDIINADEQYVRYKTLVGYEGVFPYHWEDDNYDPSRDEDYKKQKVTEYIEEITQETEDDWYKLIQRCAEAKSNDKATFGVFLHKLSKSNPPFAIKICKLNDPNIMEFITAILTGLFESDARDKYSELINDYLHRNLYLPAIARHCRHIKKDGVNFVKSILDKAIVSNEEIAVFECIAYAVEHHNLKDTPLVDNVFIPAIKYLTTKQDARWVGGAYFLPEGKAFFEELSPTNVDLIFQNLLSLNKIAHPAEKIITLLAVNNPISVWEFLKQRFRDKKDDEENYEAVPYQFHGLEKQLEKNPDLAISTLRKWYNSKDNMFRFTGGRLLHAIFPTFTAELADSLNNIIPTGSEEDCEFIISLLENYRGEIAIHPVAKELIDKLPENHSLINRIDICLNNTGVVWGEFGFADSYRNKKEEMSSWLKSNRKKVKEFAESYIRRLEQTIANEQRRAEINKELRKREYDEENE